MNDDRAIGAAVLAAAADVVERVRETPGLTQKALIEAIGVHEAEFFSTKPAVLCHLVQAALHLALARGWVREESFWPFSYRYYVVEEEL